MCSNIFISNRGYSLPNNLKSFILHIIELEFMEDINEEDDDVTDDDDDILILDEELGVLLFICLLFDF